MKQRGDELNLLLHALGKLLRLLVQRVGNLHAHGPRRGTLARLLRRQPMQLAEEDQLVDDLHFLVEAAFLGKVADALQALALEGFSKETDPSRVGNRDAHHHPNGAGLPGPVGTEQAEHLTGIDG